jgi:hypothetical protein
MSTVTSTAGAALDYLVTTATGIYAAYAAANGLTCLVLDGPAPVDSEETYPVVVWVGFDPNNPENPVVVGDQEFAALGARTRNETFTIVNTVRYWTGDTTAVKTVRDQAFALLAQFETMLRGTPLNGPGDCTLGGNVLFSQISGGLQYTPISSGSGLIGEITFHVSCRSRLTS